MAAFQVFLYGRFWVFTEEIPHSNPGSKGQNLTPHRPGIARSHALAAQERQRQDTYSVAGSRHGRFLA